MSAAAEQTIVVGSGFAGLAVAARLAEAGERVVVLEAGDELGGQASSWNQGWLHSGGLFAREHPETARDCYRALQDTLRFAPDAVEPGSEGMLYIASDPGTDAAPWREAWAAAGIPFQSVAHDEVLARLPGFNSASVQAAFLLPDRAIRPDILLEALAARGRSAGVDIRLKTPVLSFVRDDDSVHGVETTTGEAILARRVILAAGAATLDHWPELFAAPTAGQPGYRPVLLKAHLVSVRPEVCGVPFCILDRQGFNHLPHRETSIFGSARWPVTQRPRDNTVERPQAAALWTQLQELFPGFQREGCREVREWAGATIEILHVDQIAPSVDPRPTIIDHSVEPAKLRNLWSVFPGRATLWSTLADMAPGQILKAARG